MSRVYRFRFLKTVDATHYEPVDPTWPTCVCRPRGGGKRQMGKQEMVFVVYVNHPNNKAIVHETACGRHRSRRRDTTHNGHWTQPYSDIEAALNFAQSTRKRTVDTCAICCRKQMN
jgi:hypothetical protein